MTKNNNLPSLGERYENWNNREQWKLNEKKALEYAEKEYAKFLLAIPEHLRGVVEKHLESQWTTLPGNLRWVFRDESGVKSWLEFGLDPRFNPDFRINYCPDEYYSITRVRLDKSTGKTERSYDTLAKVKDLTIR